MRSAKNLFIAGTPGVGKTTLIKEVTLPFRRRVSGFYTEEIKRGNERRAFRLKTFAPTAAGFTEGVLAEKGMKSPAKIGKYGVDLKVLEGIGVAALAEALSKPGQLVVIDEIGSMETLSGFFREKLLECLQSPHPVLASIRLNAQPFTDHVKKLADTEMIRLTRERFSDVKTEVRRWLEEKLP